MKPAPKKHTVKIRCPKCGAVSEFEPTYKKVMLGMEVSLLREPPNCGDCLMERQEIVKFERVKS